MERQMPYFDRADWQRRAAPVKTDSRLSVGMSALVIAVLSALCWAAVISMAMEMAAPF